MKKRMLIHKKHFLILFLQLLQILSDCRFKFGLPDYCNLSDDCQGVKCKRFGVNIKLNFDCQHNKIVIVCNDIEKFLSVGDSIDFEFQTFTLNFFLNSIDDNSVKFKISRRILSFHAKIVDINIPTSISFMCSALQWLMQNNKKIVKNEYDYKDIKTLIELIKETGVIPWDYNETDIKYSTFEQKYFRKFINESKIPERKTIDDIMNLNSNIFTLIDNLIPILLLILAILLILILFINILNITDTDILNKSDIVNLEKTNFDI